MYNLLKNTIFILTLPFLCDAQTIINNGFGGTNNYTFSGIYTPIPPILDGELTDDCWVSSILGGKTNSNRFNTSSGVFFNTISKINNINDFGTSVGIPPASVTNPSGTSASFSLAWDENYLYYAVKVIDSRILTQTTSNSIIGEEVNLYFNNGTTRSFYNPGCPSFPRKYDSEKDMHLNFKYSSYRNFSNSIVGSDYTNFGIPANFQRYNAVTKGTTDGYILEGRISWKAVNYEFVDLFTDEYIDDSKKPNASRIPLGFDIQIDFTNSSFSARESQLSWNQCCWATNWSQTQHLGVLTLLGGPSLVTATGITISETNNGALTITSAGTALNLKATVFPITAPKNVKWKVQGTNINGFALAEIDPNGKLTPLNNGNVTVTATTLSYDAFGIGTIQSVSTITTISISNQISPTSITITSPTIDSNFGKSTPVVVSAPGNAPKLASWSMIDPNSLATINTLTGEVTSKSLSNGTVTIIGTSLTNGIIGRYVLPITKQSPIDCFGIKLKDWFSGVRTKSNVTFSGFNTSNDCSPISKIKLVAEYIDLNVLTLSGNLASEIPDDLISFTGVFGTNGSGQIEKLNNEFENGWMISFNQNNANPVTITAHYLNDLSKKSKIVGVINQAAPFVFQNCGYDIRNFENDILSPGCNPLVSIQGICVNGVQTTLVSINKATISGINLITIGGNATYTFLGYSPLTATQPVSTQWISSNSSVATINNNGELTPLSSGITNIYLLANSPANAQVTSNIIVLTVVSQPSSNTTIALQSSTISGPNSVTIGGNAMYTFVGYNPSNATLPVSIQWNSSNIAVATINSNGELTPVSTGTTNISATSNNPANVSITSNIIVLTVVSQPSSNTTIALQSSTISGPNSITIGGNAMYTFVGYNPSNATLPVSIQWNSSNVAVATINSNGELTPVSTGITNISATSNNPANISITSNVISVNVFGNQLSVLNENQSLKSIEIFPNPAKDILYIKSKNTEITHIKIANLLGEEMMNFKYYDNEINIEQLKKGIYFIIITTQQGDYITKKFIK